MPASGPLTPSVSASAAITSGSFISLVKMRATPIASSSGWSSTGIVPPTKIGMSLPPSVFRLAMRLGHQVAMAAGQDAQPDGIDVLVDRDARDVVGRLAQTGVDDLGASVAQRQGDDLGADVVAVEAGLGDQNALALQRSRRRCRS